MKKREKAGTALLAAAALSGLLTGMVFAADEKTDTGAGASTEETKTSTKKTTSKHSCKGKKTTKGDAGKSSCKGKSSCSSK
jgi:hypothetical protein